MVGTAANWRPQPVERLMDRLAVSLHCCVLSVLDKYRSHVQEKEYSLHWPVTWMGIAEDHSEANWDSEAPGRLRVLPTGVEITSWAQGLEGGEPRSGCLGSFPSSTRTSTGA